MLPRWSHHSNERRRIPSASGHAAGFETQLTCTHELESRERGCYWTGNSPVPWCCMGEGLCGKALLSVPWCCMGEGLCGKAEKYLVKGRLGELLGKGSSGLTINGHKTHKVSG